MAKKEFFMAIYIICALFVKKGKFKLFNIGGKNVELKGLEILNELHSRSSSTNTPLNFTRDPPMSMNQIIARGKPSGRECFDEKKDHYKLLKLLEKGIPKVRSNIRVVIVGGGISGLSAGYMLKKAGYNVKILEATNRVGGRIRTWRNIREGWHAEMGPMRIPLTHYFTLYLVNKFRLPLSEYRNSDEDGIVNIADMSFRKKHLNNHNIVRRILRKYEIKEKYSLPDYEHVFEEDVNKFSETGDFKKLIDKYDHISLRELLNQEGFTENEVRLLGSMGVLHEAYVKSSLEEVVNICIFGNSTFRSISTGFDSLPKAVAKHIKSSISLNVKVKQIKKAQNGELIVSSECKGFKCNPNERENYADFVIVTTTPTATMSINFDPPLSVKKNYALRNIYMAPVIKIAMVFKYPFWELFGITGGNSISDKGGYQIIYPSYSFKSGVGVILGSYTFSDAARRLASLTEDQLRDELLQYIANIHRLSFFDVHSLFIDMVVQDWNKDPNTLGGFIMPEPYHYSELLPYLREAQGRIKFAGDSLEIIGGWMDNSIKSAVRVVRDIHRDQQPSYYE